MKKIIGIILTATILTLCLCGCQKPTEENPDDSSSSIANTLEENSDDSSIPDESTVEQYNGIESLADKLTREIDEAYAKEEYLPEYSSTAGMVALADKYREKWAEVADEYYNKIMEYNGIIQGSDDYYSSDDLHTFVSNMKTSWEQYNQTQCENYIKVLETIYAGGTIVRPIFADYKLNLQKEWALRLVIIYDQLY